MKEFAIIGTRLVGAYLLIGAVTTGLAILGSVAVLGTSDARGSSFFGPSTVLVGSQALLAVVGFVLILRAGWFASALLRGVSEHRLERPTNQQLVQVGTFLLGLFFLAGALGGFLIAGWRLWDHITFHGPSPLSLFETSSSDFVSHWIQFAGSASRVVVGVVLIVMARPLSRLPFVQERDG